MPKKIEKGDTLVSAGFVGYVKKLKKERGDLMETKKIRKRDAQCRKKIEKGDPSVSAGFVGYVKKVKKKRKRGPHGDKQISKKCRTVPKKSKKGIL